MVLEAALSYIHSSPVAVDSNGPSSTSYLAPSHHKRSFLFHDDAAKKSIGILLASH